ncbi:MAG: cation transporter [Ignavibacteria bacterium]|nr:cation transporter [Ignavibacteria bacterium]
MNISLCIGLVMLGVKWWAYLITGSVVIFSDALESVVHILAVAFAWFALRVSQRPPDKDHHFGHDKISFVSAGVEGALIAIAAIAIVVTAVQRLISEPIIQNLSTGIFITAGAGMVNAALGFYLLRVGRKQRQILIEANGKHVLTDAWTSAGAVLGLTIAWWSGLHWLDPLIAIVFAANIIREGVSLVSTSVNGLMDKSNEILELQARTLLNEFCARNNCNFHRLRLRESAARVHIDFHITMSDDTPIVHAHSIATLAEDFLKKNMDPTIEVFSHIEPNSLPDDHA